MKRMLFNATHQEELRVAIVDGQKLIDLDIETAGREQRKGNIYKGVITRIEPGLEACFVNYGEDRHGFLPFKEVSRSYFKAGSDVRTVRIQDALHEGQELIIQVEKEERGNKGAALTTFVSLAGRYLVLMPNNPRGGGVSRRIEGEERQELRETMDQLDLPQGMSIIARTAGIGRSVEELQWDLSYLMQLWGAIDEAARENPAPVLIYLESSLVIRAIRDYYSPEIGEILIDTDEIHEQATAFMSVVMADCVGRVKRYQDDIPLFSRFQIEHQIETAYARTVQLPSGGSIVIDHTEALVAIDVNSARSTRGSAIEETALRTNLEAADEVARQLRLRDLGGLIVIDFIDMDDNKNQRSVEQRLRESLKVDRARVQMGKISRFGLMELSRQRLRPALNEGSHVTCPRCTGTGVIRDAESSALHVLRLLQEEAMKEGTAALYAQVPVDVATFLLNEKRSDIAKIESRLKVNLVLIPNKHLETPHHHIERLRHDDQRLEDDNSSVDLIEQPDEKTAIPVRNKTQETKPKAEALVKRITPEQPAPIAKKPIKKEEPSKPGMIARLIAWIFGDDQAKPEPQKAKRSSDSQNRNKDRSNQRNNRHRSQSERTQGRRSDKRTRANLEKDEAVAVDDSNEAKAKQRATRARRNRNRKDTNKPELQQKLTSTVVEQNNDSVAGTPNNEPSVVDTTNDDNVRSKRRRRPRRTKRSDSAATAIVHNNADNADTNDANQASKNQDVVVKDHVKQENANANNQDKHSDTNVKQPRPDAKQDSAPVIIEIPAKATPQSSTDTGNVDPNNLTASSDKKAYEPSKNLSNKDSVNAKSQHVQSPTDDLKPNLELATEEDLSMKPIIIKIPAASYEDNVKPEKPKQPKVATEVSTTKADAMVENESATLVETTDPVVQVGAVAETNVAEIEAVETHAAVETQPAAMVAVETAPVQAKQSTYKDLNLQLVETRPSLVKSDNITPAVKLGRERKPAPTQPNQQLQQVETK